MPAAMPPAHLNNALSAAAKEMDALKHQGPHGQGDHSQDHDQNSSGGFSQVSNNGGLGQNEVQYYVTSDAPIPIFQKTCSKCSWKSIASTDSGAYTGAVADLELHMKTAHAESKGAYNTAADEYATATKLRDVPATQDDALNNLSVVRYWAAPLNWRTSQLQLPKIQSPLCTVGDYEPFGLEANNRSLLKDLHDRTNKKLSLKHFSDRNLKLIPSQQENLLAFDKGNSGSIMTKKEWKELTNEKEALKASSNYMELFRSIHPLDSGPQILHKVMLEKFLLGGTSAAQLESFFASVTWELANRAAKTEVPYKHSELLVKWEQMFRSAPAYDKPAFDEEVRNSIKRIMPVQPFSPKKPKKPRNMTYWCGGFNTDQGCSNQQAGTGCKDATGKVYKHGCNVRKDGKMCNAHGHNRAGHPN